MKRAFLVVASLAACGIAPAHADDLYRPQNWSAMSSDRRASAVGDTITVIINQSAEASNVSESGSRKVSDLGGGIAAGGIDEAGSLRLSSGYNGRGEVRRSERLVAQLTVTIDSVLPNGDFAISGRQQMLVNGERSTIRVRGRVRPADIGGANQILSTRIADAEIEYDGKGFVSRGAKPGLLSRLFNLFGLL